MNKTAYYDVWIMSEASMKWEQHTYNGFLTKNAAERWVAKYIPGATTEIRHREDRRMIELGPRAAHHRKDPK